MAQILTDIPQLISHKGKIFILSGPSGVGKGTLVENLKLTLDRIVESVSATTRQPRPGETHGVDYFFLSHAEFEDGIKATEFLEWAKYNSNYYGTPLQPVQESQAQGDDVLLEIEVQGALQVKKHHPEAILIFVLPPSMQELDRRLRGRGTETEEKIAARIETAHFEIAHAHHYDYVIVNDDLMAAVERLRAIFLAERCRVCPSVVEDSVR